MYLLYEPSEGNPAAASLSQERGPPMNAQTSIEDQELARLRQEFTGHRIWRAVRRDGRLGDWVASLHDPAAGIDLTVICSDPAALRDALRVEAERAAARKGLR
ncbi:hypothetical protein [Actinomadura chokoriensis]|uniref:Uncharacterized protein n=1 Tax=Actinomadura chokoriensis TaxID=454156 RepID=A0ABV4QUM4_9ACTN